MKRILIAFVTLFSGYMNAQQFFQEYVNDGNTYVQYYAAPIFETNLFNFSDGWSHQAKTLKPLNFLLEITANYTFVPEDKQTFTFNPSEYQYVEVLDANGNPVSGTVELPTALGPKTNYKLRIKTPSGTPGVYYQSIIDAPFGIKEEIESFTNLPVGMPGAMVQLRAGLPLSSEIAIRYFPNKDFSGTQVGMFGIGIKHDIGSYLFKEGSKWHLAALIAYTGGKVHSQAPNSNDLEAVFKLSTFNLQGFVSHDWKFFSIYGSAGLTQGSSRLQVLGDVTYDYDIVDGGGNVIGTQTETVTDPLDLKHSLFVPKASVGILLNLKVLHIFAQYNLQKYSGLHAGIGINIQ